MNSKEQILNTLRQSQVKKSPEIPPVTADSEFYSDTVPSKETMIPQFEKRLTQLRGDFFPFHKTAEAAEFLQRMIIEYGSDSCLSYNFELLHTLITSKTSLKKHIKFISDQLIPAAEFAQYEVGITAADYLIARTGSVVVSSTNGGGRRLSILPPVHIVLATPSQLVFSLEDVWINISDRQNDWSTLSIISGPSRTSDIEKQLVLGAHGPKRLVVILIDTE